MSGVTGQAQGSGAANVVREVGAGEHRDDAGAGRRTGGVDRPDPRVRERAADDPRRATRR